MKEVLKITGVTFTNPDGTSRQKILSQFGDKCWLSVNLVKGTYFNELIQKPEIKISCIEKTTKQQIGFIHREDVNPEILKIKQMTGFVHFHQ